MIAVCPLALCVPKLARNMSIYFGILRFPALLEASNICRTCLNFRIQNARLLTKLRLKFSSIPDLF